MAEEEEVEDVNVDDMLEAPFSEKNGAKDGEKKRRSSRHRHGSKERDRKKDRKDKDKEKDRSKDKDEKKPSSSSSHKKKSRHKSKSRSRSPRRRNNSPPTFFRGGGFRGGFGRGRGRSPPFRGGRGGGGGSPPPFRRGGWPSPGRDITAGGRRLPGPERRDVMPFTPRRSPPRGMRHSDLTTEQRDARTVFIMQVAARTRPKDLEDFFEAVGHVRDVRIITDSKTRRSKGIAYVEFWDVEAVALALGLNGQRLVGAPLVIQPTQSEKNRAAANAATGGALAFMPQQPTSGPMKLYIGSLHFNITEDMLKGIFEPFGRIDSIQLMEDDNGRSRGYGFVTFKHADDARRAMEQLNGFELAGRPMKVGHVTEHQPIQAGAGRSLDTDELDRTGVDLGTAGRLNLMAKLAEGTGLSLPNHAQQVITQQATQAAQAATPSIATQCFMLSNMFDPAQETEATWDDDIRDDVIEECSKNGGVLHIYVDKQSAEGNVYCKCPSVASAVAAVNSLHGRWFAGKVITANYVPVSNYHQLFPSAASVTVPMQPGFKPSSQTIGTAGSIY